MNKINMYLIIAIICLAPGSCNPENKFTAEQEELFRFATENAPLVNEGYSRCLKYVNGWLELADRATGLIPRNINDEKSKDIWNAKDCAADNYPFMVLTTALLDTELFNGRMREMLETETRLTSRLGPLPDTYSFSKRGFLTRNIIVPNIIFGSAEYVKDGLIPLTEWLGPSPWSERMISIIDEIWNYASVKTPFGNIISDDPEVNGDMLQSLSRIYWIISGTRLF